MQGRGALPKGKHGLARRKTRANTLWRETEGCEKRISRTLWNAFACDRHVRARRQPCRRLGRAERDEPQPPHGRASRGRRVAARRQRLGSGPSKRVEGQTLKTWDIGDPSIERVQLSIKSDGRPMDADVQLWHTPAYIPTKFSVYSEDGKIRPVDVVIETPKHPKTVALYNTGPMEFPFEATVVNTGLDKAYKSLADEPHEHIQGKGKIAAYTFGPEVESIQVLLKTDEKNMKAKIEITEGPNQVKQTIDLYASSGYKNPFYAVIHTPGFSNKSVRIINRNDLEFPFDAWCVPCETSEAPPMVTMGGASAMGSVGAMGGAWMSR